MNLAPGFEGRRPSEPVEAATLILNADGILVIAHFDWIPHHWQQPGLSATEELIGAITIPIGTLGRVRLGIHPLWLRRSRRSGVPWPRERFSFLESSML